MPCAGTAHGGQAVHRTLPHLVKELLEDGWMDGCTGRLALQLCEAVLYILLETALVEGAERGPGSVALGCVLPAVECGLAAPSCSS